MATVIAPQQAIPGPRVLPLLSWRANMLKLYQKSIQVPALAARHLW